MAATYQFLRFPLLLPVAAAITVALFMIMRLLIDIGPVNPVAELDVPDVIIKFEPIDTPPDRTPDMILVEPVPPPPGRPAIEVATGPVDSLTSISTGVLPPVGRAEISGPGSIIVAERNPVPVVRVQPIYPMQAAERRLEGQCTVLFDITPQGTTANIRSLNCSSSLFESASVNAVARWRYSPQIVDGEPAMYHGATTQLLFRLDE